MNPKKIRIDLGMSRKEFAERIKVSRRTVESWEQGVRKVGLWNQAKIKKLIHDCCLYEKYGSFGKEQKETGKND